MNTDETRIQSPIITRINMCSSSEFSVREDAGSKGDGIPQAVGQSL